MPQRSWRSCVRRWLAITADDTVKTMLGDVMYRLRIRGEVAVPGCASAPFQRWQRRRRIALQVFLAIAGVGVVGLIAGIVLREAGAWAILIAVGAFLVLFGGAVAGILATVGSAHRYRRDAEVQPVRLDSSGIRLRGIGPIPWGDVDPPEYRRIFTKNDVGGICAVMPLTAVGRERANAAPPAQTLLIGPKPYLRFEVPVLLLPGIEGLTEAETMELFRVAHAAFAPPR